MGIIENLWALILSLKESGIILLILGGAAGVIGWLANVIAKRLMLDFKNKHEKEIEALRSELNQQNLVLSASLANLSNSNALFRERQIKSTEMLWTCIVDLRHFASPCLTFYEILLPAEYNDQSSYKILSGLQETVLPKKLTDSNSLESERPFLGEKLWRYFFILRALELRVCLKIIEWRENQSIVAWWSDKPIQSLVKMVLDPNEITLVEQSPSIQGSGCPSLQFTVSIIEKKILDEISRINSGKESAYNMLEWAKEMKQITDSLKDK